MVLRAAAATGIPRSEGATREDIRADVLRSSAAPCGLGAVLLKEDTDGHRRPVGYASRALTTTEQRYAQVDKEALAFT